MKARELSPTGFAAVWSENPGDPVKAVMVFISLVNRRAVLPPGMDWWGGALDESPGWVTCVGKGLVRESVIGMGVFEGR